MTLVETAQDSLHRWGNQEKEEKRGWVPHAHPGSRKGMIQDSASAIGLHDHPSRRAPAPKRGAATHPPPPSHCYHSPATREKKNRGSKALSPLNQLFCYLHLRNRLRGGVILLLVLAAKFHEGGPEAISHLTATHSLLLTVHILCSETIHGTGSVNKQISK